MILKRKLIKNYKQNNDKNIFTMIMAKNFIGEKWLATEVSNLSALAVYCLY